MSEYTQMLEIIKRAAIEAVGAAKPFSFTYGTVTKTSPLTISIDQKLELKPAQLLLTNAVREYAAETSAGKIILKMGLKLGEKVLLLRIQGGQSYIVLDRLEAPQ